MIAIVDYGMGNLRSVEKALEHEGGSVMVTDEPNVIKGAEKLVLPGVGACDRAAKELKQCGLWKPIQNHLNSGKPFLGICLGFQLLFEASEEGEGSQGFGVFKGRVRRFDFSDQQTRDKQSVANKVPHMGWNQIMRRGKKDCLLLEGVPDGSSMYFVHSYYGLCEEPQSVTCETEHGLRFTSMASRDRIFGTQFHPEKSQSLGLSILKNFVSL
jgi:imidazole glycerol-phosphate synthase subunit HisH